MKHLDEADVGPASAPGPRQAAIKQGIGVGADQDVRVQTIKLRCQSADAAELQAALDAQTDRRSAQRRFEVGAQAVVGLDGDQGGAEHLVVQVLEPQQHLPLGSAGAQAVEQEGEVQRFGQGHLTRLRSKWHRVHRGVRWRVRPCCRSQGRPRG